MPKEPEEIRPTEDLTVAADSQIQDLCSQKLLVDILADMLKSATAWERELIDPTGRLNNG